MDGRLKMKKKLGLILRGRGLNMRRCRAGNSLPVVLEEIVFVTVEMVLLHTEQE